MAKRRSRGMMDRKVFGVPAWVLALAGLAWWKNRQASAAETAQREAEAADAQSRGGRAPYIPQTEV